MNIISNILSMCGLVHMHPMLEVYRIGQPIRVGPMVGIVKDKTRWFIWIK